MKNTIFQPPNFNLCQITRLMSGLVSVAANIIIIAPVLAQSVMLRVEPTERGNNIRVVNVSGRNLYVKGLILRTWRVNSFGVAQGNPKEFPVIIESSLAPGESASDNLLDNSINSSTQLVLWNDGENVIRQGVLICFRNGFGNNVHQTRNGQQPCPR